MKSEGDLKQVWTGFWTDEEMENVNKVSYETEIVWHIDKTLK
jgi:hypothetical protein